MMSHFWGLIPARGGSKGVVKKNIRLLSGNPLINYTIGAAFQSTNLDSFLVSTDSEEIRDVALSAGAPVPFLRPDKFATDEASMVGTVKHALSWYENETGMRVDYIVLLQPTTPLRGADDIDRAIDLMKNSENNVSLISCYDASHVHPTIMYTYNGETLKPYKKQHTFQRRQEFDKVFVRNGAIYIIERDYFLKNNKMVNDKPLLYLMSRERSINIDEEFDLVLAEFLLDYLSKS